MKTLIQAILERIAQLTECDPKAYLKTATELVQLEFSEMQISIDVAEDIAVQRIIELHSDHVLDELWHEYCVGYFDHDTIKSDRGYYENINDDFVPSSFVPRISH